MVRIRFGPVVKLSTTLVAARQRCSCYVQLRRRVAWVAAGQAARSALVVRNSGIASRHSSSEWFDSCFLKKKSWFPSHLLEHLLSTRSCRT